MASQQGFEPRITESESVVLPITLLGNVASVQGLEPRPRAPKTLVLPLHHTEIYMVPYGRLELPTRGVETLCSVPLS